MLWALGGGDVFHSLNISTPMDYNDMRFVFFDEFETMQAKLDKDDLLKISVPDSPSWIITATKNNRYKWHEEGTSEEELNNNIHNAINAGYNYVVEKKA